MTRRSLVPRLAVLGVLILAIAGGSARADLYVFDTSNGDSNPGPYGTVEVTGGGSQVVIDIKVASGYQLNSFGFNVAAGTTLLATPFSLALTGSTAGAASWGYVPGNNSSGVGNQTQALDGFGKYSYQVSNNSDTNVTEAVLTISGSGLSLSQFEGLSSGGNSAVFAAHLKPLNGQGTFFYAAHLVPVPEPATFAIAGLGALGFLGYGLRRRAK